MNRPKFRVWDKEEQKFADWPVYFNLTNSEIVTELWYGYQIQVEEAIQDSNYIAQQSTGLFDKTGTEIYEGDILKVFVLGDEGAIAKVIFKNGMFGIEDDMHGYGYDKGLYSLHQILSLRDAEILGNIYQDEHLLEED